MMQCNITAVNFSERGMRRVDCHQRAMRGRPGTTIGASLILPFDTAARRGYALAKSRVDPDR
jgi:hypothetical protein